MNFLWSEALFALLLVPLLVLLYLWLLKRRKKTALAWSSLAIVKEAMGQQRLWRRHVPPALMLLAIAALIVAVARPTAVMTLPMVEQTVVLAMDVSGSMRATDVEPNRLVASQNAAKAFIAELPRAVRIGVVSFAGTAAVVQPPTLSREDVVAAIEAALARSTARTVIVPGHGPVSNRAELAAYRDMLVAVGRKVREQVEAGSSMDEVLALHLTSDFDERYAKGAVSPESFIRTVYRDLSKPRSGR